MYVEGMSAPPCVADSRRGTATAASIHHTPAALHWRQTLDTKPPLVSLLLLLVLLLLVLLLLLLVLNSLLLDPLYERGRVNTHRRRPTTTTPEPRSPLIHRRQPRMLLVLMLVLVLILLMLMLMIRRVAIAITMGM